MATVLPAQCFILLVTCCQQLCTVCIYGAVFDALLLQPTYLPHLLCMCMCARVSVCALSPLLLQVVWGDVNPLWKSETHNLYVQERGKALLKLRVLDKNKLMSDVDLGAVMTGLDVLLEKPGRRVELPLKGAPKIGCDADMAGLCVCVLAGWLVRWLGVMVMWRDCGLVGGCVGRLWVGVVRCEHMWLCLESVVAKPAIGQGLHAWLKSQVLALLLVCRHRCAPPTTAVAHNT